MWWFINFKKFINFYFQRKNRYNLNLIKIRSRENGRRKSPETKSINNSRFNSRNKIKINFKLNVLWKSFSTTQFLLKLKERKPHVNDNIIHNIWYKCASRIIGRNGLESFMLQLFAINFVAGIFFYVSLWLQTKNVVVAC